MRNYLDLLKHVLEKGDIKEDRTGTGTKSIFGAQLRFDLQAGFPLVTTKKIYTDSVVKELLWFLRGETNTKTLGCGIWDKWADKDGNLGNIYGKQWRDWDGIDQIYNVIMELLENPDSRRLIVSSWNVSDLDKMALPPCHALFQFYVVDGKLSCQVYQRSADMFLGVPFNIASYALLTHIVAEQTFLDVGDLIWTGGDCHIYLNHLEQVMEQLARNPLPLPSLTINQSTKGFERYTVEDFEFVGYQHHPALPGKVSV